MKYLCIILFSVLLYASVSGCDGAKHVIQITVIQITEPTDHTQGDDGGKIQYKIIFGDKSQEE